MTSLGRSAVQIEGCDAACASFLHMLGALFVFKTIWCHLFQRWTERLCLLFLPVTMGSVPTVLSPWGVIIPHALNLTFANFLCNARISHDCKLAVIAGGSPWTLSNPPNLVAQLHPSYVDTECKLPTERCCAFGEGFC